MKEKLEVELISLQYQLNKPIFYDNLNFKSCITLIMPEHTTLLEFKRTKGVITMKDVEFINHMCRGFYNIDIPSKIKGSIFMGHESNVNDV